LASELFRDYLDSFGPFDFVLIQTNMTYWYPGVAEVLEVVKEKAPTARTVIGGVYATLCYDHALTLGADLVVKGSDLKSLWEFMELVPEYDQPPLWEEYGSPSVGVLKLADGCPFRCTYCSVPQIHPIFAPQRTEESWLAFRHLIDLGVQNIVFYDDALLFRSHETLVPFLRRVSETGVQVNFHTPNALHARFLKEELAAEMVKAGFQLFFLGFESNAHEWHKRTGGKVSSHELAEAVDHLLQAGVDPKRITAYLIAGHPSGDLQQLESSMHFANSLGIRIMLSEFSPLPGTPDGEKCRKWVDLDEPLFHNKTAFTLLQLGNDRLQQLKDLTKSLNRRL
jgi:radical SAM superfamily enzyme YgiQ (UPF0313 family)